MLELRRRNAIATRSPSFALLLTGLVLLPILGGCATNIPGFSAIAPTANPREEVAKLASEYQSGQEAGLDVLAPTWFARAGHSLSEAKGLLAEGGAVQEILHNVAEGRASLEQAKTFAQVSRNTLADVIQARQDALAAGAASLGDLYDPVEAQFLELTAAVESDSLSWARRKAPEVEQSFRSVELAAIKRQTVDRIVDLIKKAKENGAQKYAPEAWEDVNKRYADLDRFISQNRYATDVMGERADEVLFYANRLVYLTEEAKHLEDESPQKQALDNEAMLVEFAQKLELPDLRNQSQRAQRRQIANAIEKLIGTRIDLQASIDQLHAELDKNQGRIVALQSEAERERERLASLESERQLNQRFAEVSAMFAPGEAQVYKKGPKLVIRVRSLNFPVGSANVLPESYPILAKVQSAIEVFDRPSVVVEGHTDSTGSAEVNDRLSQQRADAVLSYLVNNKTIEASRVSAVGMGFSEPLASDRTAEGRAENRRIDVVIDTSGAEQLPAVSAPAAN
jgi:outer membrane protein OmpA-like peptidoglycan-associated protein